MAVVPQKGSPILLSILKPKEGHSADDALQSILKNREHLVQVKEMCHYALLKSLDGSKAGGFFLFKEGADAQSLLSAPSLAPVKSAIDEVELIADKVTQQYEMLEYRLLSEGASLELSKGQVLSIVFFHTPSAEMQAIAVQPIAMHLQMVLHLMTGVKAGCLLKSVDGTRIAIVGYWESLEILLAQPDHSEEWGRMIALLGGAVVGFDKELCVVAEALTPPVFNACDSVPQLSASLVSA